MKKKIGHGFYFNYKRLLLISQLSVANAKKGVLRIIGNPRHFGYTIPKSFIIVLEHSYGIFPKKFLCLI